MEFREATVSEMYSLVYSLSDLKILKGFYWQIPCLATGVLTKVKKKKQQPTTAGNFLVFQGLRLHVHCRGLRSHL